jgi:FixJ family two-component response regulator
MASCTPLWVCVTRFTTEPSYWPDWRQVPPASCNDPMTDPDHIVYIVDDDQRVCVALYDLLCALGMNAVTFGSAAEYLASTKPDLPGCLLLDLELPEVNGLALQSQIANEQHPPIVFMTGHGDVPSSVRAIKGGAVDFLMKPLDQRALVTAIRAAIELDRTARSERTYLRLLQLRFSELTPREREVLPLVVSGLLNKQAAAKLRISEVTLQIHRSRVMRKMGADSVAALVRMAAALGIPLLAKNASER